MNVRWLNFILLIFFSSVGLASSVSTITYNGRLIKPDGNPEEGTAIFFTLKVYDSTQNCMLWSETQTLNMAGSKGAFSLVIGEGTRQDGGSHTLKQVFTNAGTIAGLTCSSGSSYTPTVNDDRKLVVKFQDGPISQTLTPMPIKAVPFAMQADQVSGYGILNLARISGGGSVSALSPGQYSQMLAFPAANCATNEILKWSGTAWACAADATGLTFNNASYSQQGIVQFDTDAGTSGINVAAGVASVNTGTGANQIVKIDGTGKLPAVNASALTGITASQIPDLDAAKITSGILPISRGGTGAATATAAFNALSPLTGKGDLHTYDGVTNTLLPVGSNGQILSADSTQATGLKWTSPSTGTVTSVGLSLPAEITVSNSPVTGTGTLTGVWASQSANKFFAAPNGVAGIPSFRVMLAADVPSLDAAKISTGTIPVARGGTGQATTFTANSLMMANGTGAAMTTGITCALNEILKWNATAWACAADVVGWVAADSSYAAKGIVQFNTNAATSGITVAAGVATVNFGTAANQIVKLDASAKLPAVDGSALTGFTAAQIPSLDAAKITTGTIPIARGGTNNGTLGVTAGGVLYGDGTKLMTGAAGTSGQPLISAGAGVPAFGTLGVSGGGTGATTLAANGVLLGNTTSAINVTAAGVADQILRIPAAGGAPVFGAIDLTKAAAVTGSLPIANGGTGGATKTAGFDNLSPMTTKGDIIVNDGTNAVRQAVGANGQVLVADSAQASGVKWQTSGVISRSFTPVTVTNTTTETAIFTYLIPGGTLGTQSGVRLLLAGTHMNNSGNSTRTVRIKVNFGATTIFDDTSIAVPTSAVTRAYRLNLELFNSGVTNAQVMSGFVSISNSSAPVAGTGDFTVTNLINSAIYGTAAVDSTVDQTLTVTVKHSSANTMITLVNQAAILEFLY